MHVCACFVTVDCKRTATVPFAPALLCCGFLPRADTVRFPALARSAPQPASLRSVPFRLFLVSSRRHQFLSKAGAVVFPNQRRQEFPRPLGSLPGAPCVHHRVVAQEEDVPLLPHHVDRQVLADVPGLQQHVQRDRIAVPEPDALVDPLLGGDVDERVVPAAAVSVVAVPLADPPELEGIGRGGDELVEKTFLGWLPLFAVSRCHLDGLEDGRRAPQKILSQRHARGTDAPLPVPPTGPQLCLAFLLGASVKEGLPGPPGSPGRVLVRPRKDGVPDPLFLELCANGRVPLSELPVDHGARDDPRLAAVPGPRRELAAKKDVARPQGGLGLLVVKDQAARLALVGGADAVGQLGADGKGHAALVGQIAEALEGPDKGVEVPRGCQGEKPAEQHGPALPQGPVDGAPVPSDKGGRRERGAVVLLLLLLLFVVAVFRRRRRGREDKGDRRSVPEGSLFRGVRCDTGIEGRQRRQRVLVVGVWIRGGGRAATAGASARYRCRGCVDANSPAASWGGGVRWHGVAWRGVAFTGGCGSVRLRSG
mmetsp:Transcript_28919/g.62016  ORF Transcript_28919/g.62016 Transcript_28919/m.62016 type:complete len:538 (+) Transcript_28919:376-1989(+)